jgi:predicted RNA binding protein YcfA (HicA-like mRNA interferase family)
MVGASLRSGAIKGDHRQFKYPKRAGRVTLVGHPSKDMPPKTLASVFRRAQLPKP